MGNQRGLSPELEAEYLSLKAFFRVFIEYETSESIPLDIHPLTMLDELERKAPKRALLGLKMAINDCVEMASDWQPSKVSQLDDALRLAGIITLSAVRHRYTKNVASILKRGKLRTEVEYYLVAGVLADVSTPLTHQERLALEAMSHAYASKAP
jgi:hypothetical protein